MGVIKWLMPDLSVEEAILIFKVAFAGLAISGGYGLVHDQLTFSLSDEYFVRMKFTQFERWWDGCSDRVFAAQIGIQGSWWAGLISGWVFGRVAVWKFPAERVLGEALKGLGIAFLLAVCGGVAGYGLSFAFPRPGSYWVEISEYLEVVHISEFRRVGYIHIGGYVGAAIGVVAGLLHLLRRAGLPGSGGAFGAFMRRKAL